MAKPARTTPSSWILDSGQLPSYTHIPRIGFCTTLHDFRNQGSLQLSCGLQIPATFCEQKYAQIIVTETANRVSLLNSGKRLRSPAGFSLGDLQHDVSAGLLLTPVNVLLFFFLLLNPQRGTLCPETVTNQPFDSPKKNGGWWREGSGFPRSCGPMPSTTPGRAS